MAYANEAFYALLRGVLVNVVVNQNNTTVNEWMSDSWPVIIYYSFIEI